MQYQGRIRERPYLHVYSNPNFIFSEKYKICVNNIMTDIAILLAYTYWI